jgi:hypothetical protein
LDKKTGKMDEEIEKIYFLAGAGWFDRAAVQAGEAGGVAQTAAGDNAAALKQEEDKAWQYFADGRYKEAEPLNQRALSILKKKFPAGHPAMNVMQENYDELKRKTAEQKQFMNRPCITSRSGNSSACSSKE